MQLLALHLVITRGDIGNGLEILRGINSDKLPNFVQVNICSAMAHLCHCMHVVDALGIHQEVVIKDSVQSLR